MKQGMRFLTAMALAGSATLAQAGSIEDAFRGFLDSMRAGGKSVIQSLPGGRSAIEVTKPELAKRVDGLPLGQDHYVLFVANGCRACPAVAEKLRKRNRGTVEVLNISTSTTAREAFILTQAKGVPAMLMGNYVMSGYSDKLYERALINSINDRGVSMQGQGN